MNVPFTGNVAASFAIPFAWMALNPKQFMSTRGQRFLSLFASPRSARRIAFVAATFLTITPVRAQVPNALLYSLFHPGTGAQFNTQQGSAVAVDGNIAITGAYADNTGGYSSGVVKVYDANSGALLHTLTNPAPATDDYFGNSVAISGTRIVVAAFGDDAGKTDAGSAYVFDLSSANPTLPVLTLTNPSPTRSLFYGWDVGIAGTKIVVGVPYDNTGAPYAAGVAHVYDLASPTPAVPVMTLTNP